MSMKLEDLVVHIDDQELKIKESINNNHFVDLVQGKGDSVPSWATFRNTVWGNKSVLESQKNVDTDTPMDKGGLNAQQEVDMNIDDDVDAEGDNKTDAPATVMEIPGSLPDVWNFRTTHIFVRSEYRKTEQEVLESNEVKDRAFLVGGQAGIGKSFFLIWLLIRRLAFCLPTALQIDRDKAILFHGGGTSIFQDLQDVMPYLALKFENHLSRIWVLVDSNNDLEKPAAVFCKGQPFFVVEAASLSSRFEWAKKVQFRNFYMKTWTLSELLQARSYMGLPDESIVRYLFKTYRLPPRELVNFADRPESLREHIVCLVKNMTIDAVRNVLRSPDSDEPFNLITRVEPTPCRFAFEKTIASPFVFQQLWDYHLRFQTSDTARFYYIFCRGGPATATSAGWIFESRMHQLLVRDYAMTLFPISRAGTTSNVYDLYSKYNTENRSIGTHFQLATLQEKTLGKGIELEVNCYYRPEPKIFPAIDSLLLIHPVDSSPILLIFQFTWNKDKYDAKERGLDAVDHLKVPQGTCKYYVVVTPSGIQPKIKAPKGRFVDDRHHYVRVFHHPVQRNKLFPL